LTNDLLLVFQKRRLRLDTKSKGQYDSEGSPSKTVIFENHLIVVFKKQTPTVKVITVRLRIDGTEYLGFLDALFHPFHSPHFRLFEANLVVP
jgi:hypothetical protein